MNYNSYLSSVIGIIFKWEIFQEVDLLVMKQHLLSLLDLCLNFGDIKNEVITGISHVFWII
jgi:hypothetical protein